MKKSLTMKTILLISLLIFCSCSKESSKVEYLQSDENEKNNYPFSEAVKVGEILYLSGQIGTSAKNG